MRVLLAALFLAAVGGCSGDQSGERQTATGNVVGGGTAGSGPTAGLGCPDRDADGIADDIEGQPDPDRDGRANADDLDSDGDGADDAVERGSSPCLVPLDSDSDGLADYLDTDSDGDGIGDLGADRTLDTDRDGIPNVRDADDDGDIIPDQIELGASPAAPLDSDADGIPDHLDLDSDADGVPDRAAAGANDTDQDGILDHLDADADGDGIADIAEVGANAAMPRDTDSDGAPDYLDADSDSDGLHDGLEDANGNGALDPTESDPRSMDTDADGADDLVEAAAKTDPRNPTVNPQSEGNFVFVVPYQQPPGPPNATLDFATDLVRADVVFSLDTTGSMGEELEQLRSDLRGQIIPALSAQIPDLAFGVASYEDFPVFPFGDPGDQPIRLVTPITTDAAVAQAGIDRLMIMSGGDGPESGAEALYQLATGAGVNWSGGQIAPFETGWRDGALPIFVQITDAAMNSAETYNTFVPAAASLPKLQKSLDALGAKVIAVVSQGGDTAAATEQYLPLVRATGATVPPDAFGTTGKCETGVRGAAVAPDANGSCPLLFGIDELGAGLGASIVEAVGALAKYAVLDIDARAANEPGNRDAQGKEVDAIAAFLDRVVPNAAPATTTACAKGLATEDRLAMDGREDTFVDVAPGQRVCFDVIAKQNQEVEQQPYPQLFRAHIDLVGDGVTALDSRQVWFLVPPTPPKPGDRPVVVM